MRPWKEQIEDVKLLAKQCPGGCTVGGLVCPFCGGGNSKDRSFCITREGSTILYNCFRASCGRGGRIVGDRTILPSVEPGKRPIKRFEGVTTFLTDAQYGFFESRYGLKRKEINKAGFMYCPELSRFVQPVFGCNNKGRGVVLRGYAPEKKVSSFREKPDEPWQCWYFCPDTPRGLLIVEDQLSALKASRYYDVVALLNTSLGPDKALEISQTMAYKGFSKALMVLDGDAKERAITLHSRWHGIIPGLGVKFPSNPRDIKYWNDEEIKELCR